ncbi:invasion associated locus B family protein [Kaistia dalseonensis]|uniref:Invasion protein IalB n=1 Tax=Kaistia dalseonensis TaxID=410840 RepID=A0ABU0HC60_9HYPH|nr:invasion associated locus B family protein [Kaistia dalseonensis]MCX5497261.1 invasion associated locus B family protein [Kaistia dalseonensis]MDQ0439897.1 invasion protein IalB [Kaistia dalseonensis]
MTYRIDRLRALAMLAVMAAGAPTLAVAQDQAPAGQAAAKAPPPWLTVCQGQSRDAALDCQMEQRVMLQNTGQFVGSLTIRVPADGRKPTLMIRGPLGVTLAAGATIDVDGASAVTMPLQTCDNTGCYAGAPLSGDLLNAMVKGQVVNLTFQNLSKAPVSIPLSLSGFSAAYAKIK